LLRCDSDRGQLCRPAEHISGAVAVSIPDLASNQFAFADAVAALGPTSDTVRSGSFKLTRVAAGLKSPLYVTNAGDGSGRLFIVEQAGPVLVIKDGRVLPTPFSTFARWLHQALSTYSLTTAAESCGRSSCFAGTGRWRR